MERKVNMLVDYVSSEKINGTVVSTRNVGTAIVYDTDGIYLIDEYGWVRENNVTVMHDNTVDNNTVSGSRNVNDTLSTMIQASLGDIGAMVHDFQRRIK